jgi:hypothetical protein
MERILGRRKAQELTQEQIMQVSGGLECETRTEDTRVRNCAIPGPYCWDTYEPDPIQVCN